MWECDCVHLHLGMGICNCVYCVSVSTITDYVIKCMCFNGFVFVSIVLCSIVCVCARVCNPPCVCGAGFVVEVQLDHLKQTQKESLVRRTLFLDSQQPSLLKTITMANGGRTCHDTRVYLRVSHFKHSKKCWETLL